MKELNNNILNKQQYSSNTNEYSFTVGKGKNTKNVILKLDISSEEEITEKEITDELVKYINAFEDIVA